MKRDLKKPSLRNSNILNSVAIFEVSANLEQNNCSAPGSKYNTCKNPAGCTTV